MILVYCMLSVCCAVVVIGFGLNAIDGALVLKRDRGSHREDAKQYATTEAAFQPLSLPPLGLLWPSELPPSKSALPELPWPSETWTDNFFERRGTSLAPPASQARSNEPVKAAPAKAKRRSKKNEPAPSDDNVPSPDEIAGWVEEHGLATAVERIREQTGWDFQRAAKYLSEVLRSRNGAA